MERLGYGELWGRGAAEVKWQLNGLQDAFSHQFCCTVLYPTSEAPQVISRVLLEGAPNVFASRRLALRCKRKISKIAQRSPPSRLTPRGSTGS